MSAVSGHEGVSGTHLNILDAAAKLFRLHGYEATTLRGIASECGLKAGSIYYHFSSKDEILDEILDFGIQNLLRRVRSCVEELETESGLARIRAAIRMHLLCMLEYGDYTAVNIRLFSGAPKAIQERALVSRRQYEDYWKSLFESAEAAGEIRDDVNLSMARLFLFGGMSWMLEWYRSGGMGVEEIADHYAKLLFEGVAEHPGGTV